MVVLVVEVRLNQSLNIQDSSPFERRLALMMDLEFLRFSEEVSPALKVRHTGKQQKTSTLRKPDTQQ